MTVGLMTNSKILSCKNEEVIYFYSKGELLLGIQPYGTTLIFTSNSE